MRVIQQWDCGNGRIGEASAGLSPLKNILVGSTLIERQLIDPPPCGLPFIAGPAEDHVRFHVAVGGRRTLRD
jgi:hypothetical protein